MIYCDTSLIISVLVPEQLSELADPWLAQRDLTTVAFSGWTDTEVASALAQKSRAGAVTADLRAKAVAVWREMSQKMARLQVLEVDFTSSMSLVDAGPRGLRSGDALHLAIAKRVGFAIATLDRDLADAAEASGVEVALRPPA